MLPRRFSRMLEIYKIFANDWKDCLDFSDASAWEIFNHETFGHPMKTTNNGFYYGKRYLNLQVTSWKEDMAKGNFFVQELYADPKYPQWWLDSVFEGCPGWANRFNDAPIF